MRVSSSITAQAFFSIITGARDLLRGKIKSDSQMIGALPEVRLQETYSLPQDLLTGKSQELTPRLQTLHTLSLAGINER